MLPVVEEISKLKYFPNIRQDMKDLVGPELYTAVGRIYGGLFPGGPLMIPTLHRSRRYQPQPGVPIEEVKGIIEGALQRARRAIRRSCWRWSMRT